MPCLRFVRKAKQEVRETVSGAGDVSLVFLISRIVRGEGVKNPQGSPEIGFGLNRVRLRESVRQNEMGRRDIALDGGFVRVLFSQIFVNGQRIAHAGQAFLASAVDEKNLANSLLPESN